MIKSKIKERGVRINIDWLMGFITAIPFSYPSEPFYYGALVVLMLFLTRLRLSAAAKELLILLGFFLIIIVLSNFFSSFSSLILPLSVGGTILSLSLFLARFGIRDFNGFISGFLFVIYIYIFLTFFLFFLIRPFDQGLSFYFHSEKRMWGSGFLPEWPIVFSTFLTVGAFFFWFRENYVWMILALAAALLTSSRLPFLAVIIFFFYFIYVRFSVKIIFYLILILILTVIAIIFSYDIISSSADFDALLDQRILKSDDRFYLFEKLLSLSASYPFGIGNVSYSSFDDIYQSYHSSFLKVLVRYGYLGLIVYMAIVIPRNFGRYFSLKETLLIVFLLLSSVVNDLLFHLHIIIIYSVLLGLRDERIKRSLNNVAQARSM
jgi:hypothetical protein